MVPRDAAALRAITSRNSIITPSGSAERVEEAVRHAGFAHWTVLQPAFIDKVRSYGIALTPLDAWAAAHGNSIMLQAISASSALASCRSAVAKPSVNQP